MIKLPLRRSDPAATDRAERGEKSYPTPPRPRSGAAAERSYPTPEVRAEAKTSYHSLEVRGGGQEELPHVQGAAALRAQEGQEEILHVQGQEGLQ